MDFIYIKLEHVKYGGKRVYYQYPIDTNIHKANVFNQHYDYFYKEDHETEYRSLGGFRNCGMSCSGSCYYDYDYPVYEFDHGTVDENKRVYIYCRGIPEDCIHLEPIEHMTYLDYPVFVSTR